MLNPCLLAKGVNGEIYEIPESLRKRLLVSPDRLTELRAATRAPDFYERHGGRSASASPSSWTTRRPGTQPEGASNYLPGQASCKTPTSG
jgi:hypothetical protein